MELVFDINEVVVINWDVGEKIVLFLGVNLMKGKNNVPFVDKFINR